MTRLQPLTAAEIERMRDVYSMSPLETTPRTERLDAALRAKGWAKLYDGERGTITPARAAYRADNGRAALYDAHGRIVDCWRA